MKSATANLAAWYWDDLALVLLESMSLSGLDSDELQLCDERLTLHLKIQAMALLEKQQLQPPNSKEQNYFKTR